METYSNDLTSSCEDQMKQVFKKIYLGCVGSLLLRAGFLQLRRTGLLSVAVRGLLIAVASLVAEHGL